MIDMGDGERVKNCEQEISVEFKQEEENDEKVKVKENYA